MRERERERESEEGWTMVRPRWGKATRPGDVKIDYGVNEYRGQRYGSGYGNSHSKGWVSYYFTNWPNDCNIEDLWKVFLRHGMVHDVFVASKLNKFGKRFGFVHFKNIHDPKMMEEKFR